MRASSKQGITGRQIFQIIRGALASQTWCTWRQVEMRASSCDVVSQLANMCSISSGGPVRERKLAPMVMMAMATAMAMMCRRGKFAGSG